MVEHPVDDLALFLLELPRDPQLLFEEYLEIG
jgi:hypothetical protein